MTHAMTPAGDYDRHSRYQEAGAQAAELLVVDAAAAIPLAESRPEVLIVDYGSAQGRVSNRLIGLAIDQIRAADAEIPITVCHNDVLENDWGTLLHSLTAPDAYPHRPGGPIRPTISATTFFEPVTRPGTVDLGMSFAAAQWLSRPGPRDAGTALYFDQLEGAAREAMALQAHEDWSRFLHLRADELTPSGLLVINMMHVPDGHVAAGHQLWGYVRDICEAMANDGLIEQSRLDSYVFPVWERSTAEVLRPFSEELGQRLVVDQVVATPVPDPMAEAFARDGDASRYASSVTGFFRAFSEPTLRAGLRLDDRAGRHLYASIEERIHAAAAQFRFSVNGITVVLRPRAF